MRDPSERLFEKDELVQSWFVRHLHPGPTRLVIDGLDPDDPGTGA